ncbi:hypothetical protein Tco_1511315 [Tanacetum coccineum]
MDRKSTSSAYQLLGGKLVCWSVKKQQSIAMSSAEAEYVAAVGCRANILWMKSQLTDYDTIYKKVPIFCDNTSAIAILNNPILHSRTKHIDIRYHFISDHILKGDVELYFIPTQYQLADIFTKPLDEPTFKILIVELELTINPTQVFSVYNWILNPNQPEKPPFTDHMKAIYNLDVPVDSKAPKYSSPTEEVPQGKKPGARSGLKRKLSSKHTSESTTKASKSQSGHSKKETKSSSAINTSPSHPSPPTLVVGEMHKEAQQAAGGPISLGDTSEDGAYLIRG